MVDDLVAGNLVRAGGQDGRTLTMLEEVQPLYLLPSDPFVEEVLIPGFQAADNVECMVGFFSGEVLASLAPGLATYIAHSENSFRLIISPLLSAEDQAAIEDGLRSPESVAIEILDDMLVTEDSLQLHTLRCLSCLLRRRRIEIKVALMKNALFHPKVWLFANSQDVVAAHGSSNCTRPGIAKNVEQVAVSRSWLDPYQRYITDKLSGQFALLWGNNTEDCVVITMPDAIRQRLLRTYDSDVPPTEQELQELYRQATGSSTEVEKFSKISLQNSSFRVPSELRYETGPFEHQGKAICAWRDAGHRGILEMATGSGKTIAAMIGAHQLYEMRKPLLIIVCAPYVPLIEQWCDEIVPFGVNPTNLTAQGGTVKRISELKRLKRRLLTGVSNVEVVVVTHETMCTLEFHNALQEFECSRLLIADEVHNLGRPAFIANPPEFFEYRLGLSATPIRQYDDEGTAALFDYFGSVVFRFTLEDAIGHCLVEYDYYVHPVYLNEDEMANWFDLTGKIKQNAWRNHEGGPDDYLAKLLRDRRALLETAAGKMSLLRSLLESEDTTSLRHTLIYTSDKAPEQLDAVNRLLREKNVLFHQLTAAETSNREQTRCIIKSFQDGEIQVVTAKRVLDEGVNIPQVCKTFILASTTVARQWIQRRGRLLRKCSAVGKTHGTIHDLLALPPGMEEGLDPDARTIVRSELQRAQEFAGLARNAGRPDGPLATIDQMVNAAFL